MILGAGMWPSGWNPEECQECDGVAGFTALPDVDERQEIAVHEAGHAFVYQWLGIEVGEVAIGGSADFAAYTMVRPHDQGSLPGLAGLWAGSVATREWLARGGRLDEAAEVDVAQAARTDARIICRSTSDLALIQEARELAERLIVRHWSTVEGLAAALADGGSLSGPRVGRVVAQARRSGIVCAT